jgi:formate hydrogenlyase subunit 6/NADH:ubiquinone oxidoreductase subunit I
MLFRIAYAMRITLGHAFARKSTTAPSLPFRGQPTLCLDERGYPLCTACGACVEICPTRCIHITPDQDRAPIQIDGSRCLFCSICVTICPIQALGMDSETRRYVCVTSQDEDLPG